MSNAVKDIFDYDDDYLEELLEDDFFMPQFCVACKAFTYDPLFHFTADHLKHPAFDLNDASVQAEVGGQKR